MNQIEQIMTKNPVCCNRDTKIDQVAGLMVQHDCGEIPVVENGQGKKLVGVITDRDIVVRSVARGINPLELSAEDCMTANPVTAKRDLDIEKVCHLMEQNHIRRIPVVDDNGFVVGIVSQADIATSTNESGVAHLVRDISQASQTSVQ
jgi:CBS domain-containing protein